ncbi:MAG: polysaccharide deacetylase family protein [Acidobacteriaceae bacterium]
MTYDDGPNDPYTFRLLEVLAEHEVRATFFYDWSLRSPAPRDRSRRSPAAGHLISNHTMTHPLLLVRPSGIVRQQLRDCNAALEDVLDAPVRWFCPLHGGRRPDVLRAVRDLGLTPVTWECDGV